MTAVKDPVTRSSFSGGQVPNTFTGHFKYVTLGGTLASGHGAPIDDQIHLFF